MEWCQVFHGILSLSLLSLSAIQSECITLMSFLYSLRPKVLFNTLLPHCQKLYLLHLHALSLLMFIKKNILFFFCQNHFVNLYDVCLRWININKSNFKIELYLLIISNNCEHLKFKPKKYTHIFHQAAIIRTISHIWISRMSDRSNLCEYTSILYTRALAKVTSAAGKYILRVNRNNYYYCE